MFIAEAMKIASSRPRSKLYGELLVSRAGVEASRDQAQLALADYQAAYKVFSIVSDRRAQAVTLQDIGLIYQDAGDPQRALYYYNQAEDTFSAEPMLELSARTNRANALDELERFRESQVEYSRALTLARKLKSPSLQAQILNNLAIAEMTNGQRPAAESSIASGLRITSRIGAEAWRPVLLGTAARFAFDTDQIAKANAYLKELFQIHDENDASQLYRVIHATAYRVYKQQRQFKRALRHFEIYQQLKEQSRKLTASTSAELMTARFDFSNQNARIGALKADQLRREVTFTQFRARQSQMILGGLLAFAIALVALLGLYIRSNYLRNKADRISSDRLLQINLELEHAGESKSEFLATTSHEIRTPLNGVLGMTQVLLADPLLDAQVRERVSIINTAGETIRLLVDDLLDLSKMDAGPVELDISEFDLRSLIVETIQLWTAQADVKNLKLCWMLDDCPDKVRGDPRRLRQILSNLLSNAIKFTLMGQVAVAVSTEHWDGGNKLLIRVEDTGIGIPAAARDRVFEKFTQLDQTIARRFGGTGLGLAIARSLARAMDGDITVTSGTQCGSVFTVALPLHRVGTLDHDHYQDDETRPHLLSESTILVLEYNPITRSMLKVLLEPIVSRILIVSSPSDALNSLTTERIDVVLIRDSRARGDYDNDLAEVAKVAVSSGARALVITEASPSRSDESIYDKAVIAVGGPISLADLVDLLRQLINGRTSEPVSVLGPKMQFEGA